MPWNQAATSIGSGNSYVYAHYRPELQVARLRPGGLRSPQYRRPVVRLPGSEVPQRCAQRASLHREWLGNDRIFQYRSGDPLTILSSSATTPTLSQNRDRAVYQRAPPTAGSACAGGTVNCKSLAESSRLFGQSAAGTFGNVVKGSFVGPHYVDWDGSLSRKFAFTERASPDLPAEYFNLLNHTNLGDPGTTSGLDRSAEHARTPAPQFSRTTGPARRLGNNRPTKRSANRPVVIEAGLF